MSILRWNFKTNMDKTICSSDDGQIMLVLSPLFSSGNILSQLILQIEILLFTAFPFYVEFRSLHTPYKHILSLLSQSFT